MSGWCRPDRSHSSRVVTIDILTYPTFGESVRIIACIKDAEVTDKILTHLHANSSVDGGDYCFRWMGNDRRRGSSSSHHPPG